MKNKRASATGEWMTMLYAFVIIFLIFFIIFGISAFAYSPYIDVRDIESIVLMKKTINCLSPNGELFLDNVPLDSKNFIEEYCNIKNVGRFYIEVELESDSGKIEKHTIYQGDSDLTWVKNTFNTKWVKDDIWTYRPGFYEDEFDIYLIKNNLREKGSFKIKVLINPESN